MIYNWETSIEIFTLTIKYAKGPNHFSSIILVLLVHSEFWSLMDSRVLRHCFKHSSSVLEGSVRIDRSSEVTPYFSRICWIVGHCRICSSFWMTEPSQCGQKRWSCGTRFQRPVSLRSRWEQRRMRVNTIRKLSSINGLLSANLYMGCTDRSGFNVRYKRNFVRSGGISVSWLQRTSRSVVR